MFFVACKRFEMKAFLVWTIRGYQKMISKYTPPTCRFHPSCSNYAIGAYREHGVIKGTWLAGYRILRCNPFVPGGEDPVPPSKKNRI